MGLIPSNPNKKALRKQIRRDIFRLLDNVASAPDYIGEMSEDNKTIQPVDHIYSHHIYSHHIYLFCIIHDDFKADNNIIGVHGKLSVCDFGRACLSKFAERNGENSEKINPHRPSNCKTSASFKIV